MTTKLDRSYEIRNAVLKSRIDFAVEELQNGESDQGRLIAILKGNIESPNLDDAIKKLLEDL